MNRFTFHVSRFAKTTIVILSEAAANDPAPESKDLLFWQACEVSR